MDKEEVETNSLLARQAKWLDSYQPAVHINERGRVVAVGDGIAWITGLPSAAMDDILSFADGSTGMVFDLTNKLIGAVLLRDSEKLTSGTSVKRTGRTLSIAVGDALLGRIIDPLGMPLDNKPRPKHSRWLPLETASPPIVARDFVVKPLYTGNKIIDTMIPIGKGQRQLLIGDEGLGRSSIALDTVINQRGQNVYCVYVLIGQKRSSIVNTINILRKSGALDYTTVIVAEASSLPGLQHLAPFAGCAAAEFWMQQGHDVLVVYDDLSTHAKTYRELSLLLRRPPGREAYPGDIFSVHARLLERTTCLNAANGGGSMTALPIVETKLGEITAYIPTNLISITDGQIYFDQALFAGGFRPAIDIARSISRIGGQAQHPSIKKEAGRMKLDYLRYLELEIFTRFGARLEASMEKAIHRGRLLREILKQDRLSPLPATFDMAWLVAFNDDMLEQAGTDKIPPLLATLEASVSHTTLTLDSPRDQWADAVTRWLGPVGD
ncbi:F0F1 ATP synthase subunit alpha [Methylophaga sp. OBS4]|uniref:F0F1 ATP synthase subunit alpha n=1 Tax=Methylophaga sp. OBS4 TaxID=2991935 RepID=UPI0022522374|nr:F0F1 ATP synthase subunit alpha [Methylophaga sp. OBS4]MCX4186473.1 F0F1 ATP synthase subunit alpha [Methylophaga sp. OBS4]